MGLRMKGFNILEVHWKILFLGGVHKKPVYRGDCLKREAWTVCRFKGGLGKKERGSVFEEGIDTRMHTMTSFKIYVTALYLIAWTMLLVLFMLLFTKCYVT